MRSSAVMLIAALGAASCGSAPSTAIQDPTGPTGPRSVAREMANHVTELHVHMTDFGDGTSPDSDPRCANGPRRYTITIDGVKLGDDIVVACHDIVRAPPPTYGLPNIELKPGRHEVRVADSWSKRATTKSVLLPRWRRFDEGGGYYLLDHLKIRVGMTAGDEVVIMPIGDFVPSL